MRKPLWSVESQHPEAVLSPDHGHWLTGFSEAEGSFRILPNNAGQSWSCGFELVQRDDDWRILADLQDMTGLGTIRPVRAVGNSRAQVRWSITTIRDCGLLAGLLERFPLRGRKVREFELWSRALYTWGDRSLERRDKWARMGELARTLKERREYVEPAATAPDSSRPPEGLPPAFIGGFITGEGCLSLNASGIRLTVKVRRDDRPLLEEIRRTTGLGKLWDGPAQGSSRPTTSWVVLRHDEVAEVAQKLDGKLRGRRRRELEAWSRAAREFRDARRAGRRRNEDLIATAAQEFACARRYRAPPPVERRTVNPEHPDVAILRILRAWAATHDGRLSSAAYATWRSEHPGCPDRNTVARTFGSWSAALKAAGLEARSASTAAARAARARGRATAAAANRRNVDRDRIALAVIALTAERGHAPGASEYFAWRLEHSSELPSQATTYRLFPGGWAEVLAHAAGRSDLGELTGAGRGTRQGSRADRRSGLTRPAYE